ncbi:hypothetical protein PV08_07672 [Exophiala spinifera]|uniref:Transcription factor TFIIIC triple barrel domain-containing protein n=1 Tax=Exophiala spinifera TaxID=91928 RepID=A0A0D1ZPZ8_9EURO|nr:uncharacterized protein PV08_07672 [Exophiala spinifera]KIW14887.1 hypothetical protein PV08_07672 [Exophiala spinifera]
MFSDDEFEYEYDDNETETFFVDLDLSTLNSRTRATVPGGQKPAVPVKPAADDSVPQTPDRFEIAQSPPGIPVNGDDDLGAQDKPKRSAVEGDDDDTSAFGRDIQILDFPSTNPVVSYRGQVYSCMWTDMIGTNMFFTSPGSMDRPLRRTDAYDLVGISRIKLVAEHAKVAKQRPTDGSNVGVKPAMSEHVLDGSSLGDFHRSSPVINAQIKKQASFLEKLMDIKRQRGERDIVRAYVNEDTAMAGGLVLDGTTRDELETLSRKVLNGDGNALAQLQEIYSRLKGQDQNPQENAPTPSSQGD